MDYIGNIETEKIIKNLPNLDFVAYIITPWHAHSFVAALKYIEEKESRTLNGIIILKEHSVSNQLIDDNFFTMQNVRVYKFKDDESLFDRIKSEISGVLYYLKLKQNNNPSFYLFRPTGFRYPILSMLHKACRGKRKITVVELDEGAGTYLLNKKEWFDITLNVQKNIKNKIIVYIKYIETSILNEKKIREFNQYINCNLFIKQQNGRCSSNGKMPIYFKDAIFDYASSINIQMPHFPERYILINTQPFDDYSLSGKDTKNKLLSHCIQVMVDLGYEVYIKPHPRENDLLHYQEMGAKILDYTGISQEGLLAISNIMPAFIVGYFSTTLVTANVLFDIPTISLNKLLLETGDVNGKYTTIFNNFEVTFSEFVNFVSDFEGFQKILS